MYEQKKDPVFTLSTEMWESQALLKLFTVKPV